MGALFFDHGHPPDRGYGYVGASRFRTAEGVYHYGRFRRSDWRPVGEPKPMEADCREGDSANTDSGDEQAMERDLDYDSSEIEQEHELEARYHTMRGDDEVPDYNPDDESDAWDDYGLAAGSGDESVDSGGSMADDEVVDDSDYDRRFELGGGGDDDAADLRALL